MTSLKWQVNWNTHAVNFDTKRSLNFPDQAFSGCRSERYFQVLFLSFTQRALYATHHYFGRPVGSLETHLYQRVCPSVRRQFTTYAPSQSQATVFGIHAIPINDCLITLLNQVEVVAL